MCSSDLIGPSDDATRIESGSRVPGPPIPPQDGPPRARIDAIERVHRTRPTGRVGETNGHVPVAGREPTTTGLASLIREAEALHEALADARSRAGRLVVALRKQRRRERLVAATLASLRQLRLQDVAD